jgi:TolB-like protein/Flp pilus assembly protein TadD
MILIGAAREPASVRPFEQGNPGMQTVYAFGPFRLDAGAELLFRGNEPMPLGQRAVALLRLLVERAGTPVSKDDLIEAAWPGLTVEESNLTVQIAALRRVFEAEPGGGSWIETLPRRGYRYTGPAVARDGQGAEARAAPPAPAPAPTAPPTTEPAAALTLPEKPSIAVLPFENLSGDPDQEYFADGLAEDIITSLSRFHWFFVIARNSSFTYKGRAVDVKQVARELGVQYVLEGSVRKTGNRVRITAQLIDALTGRHVWAERYDRNIEDIFAVQDEVTEAIVAAVAPSFISAEARRIERKTPESLDAWDYAMRGNWHFSRGGREDVAEARRLFEKALELDPKSTLALCGLTFAISFLISNAMVDDADEARRLGLDAARRAVELDENDALAHVALSMSHFMLHEFDPAVAANRQALKLNPNLAAAEAWLAAVLSWRGDADEAVAHAETAMRLNPYDQHSLWSVGPTAAYFGAGRYEEAVKAARKMIDAVPDIPIPWRYLIASLVHLGRIDEARAAKDQLLRIVPHQTLRQLEAHLPSFDPDRKHRFIDGLRQAGVPE